MSEERNEQSEQPTETDTDSVADQPTDQTDENTESASQGEPADTAEASDDEEDSNDNTEVDKWKSLARKHERENSKARRELDQLREQITSHETAEADAQNALASERLHTKLARAGMSEEDASALIEHIDPKRLVEDGKPSAKAIESVAASLSRSLTRGVDEDQGQTSETPSFSADQWLRKKARK